MSRSHFAVEYPFHDGVRIVGLRTSVNENLPVHRVHFIEHHKQPRRVQDLRKVRHSPCARRIVGQAAHVWIVFAEPLLHEFGRPGLIRETTTGRSLPMLSASGEPPISRPQNWPVAGIALIDRGSVPDAGEVRLPVGESRCWGGQIGSPVGLSRHVGRWVVQPLSKAGSWRP